MLCFRRSYPLTRSRCKRRPISRRRAGQVGFSLIELLVAVAIMGLLIGLVGPAAMRQLSGSKVKTATVQIAQLKSALDLYFIDIGRYPSREEGLFALVAPPEDVAGWAGPYIDQDAMPKDPWGGSFRYGIDQGRPIIVSYGADGEVGGEGEDADVRG